MTLPAFPIFILLVLSVQVGREKNLFLKRELVFSCTHIYIKISLSTYFISCMHYCTDC